MNHTTVVTCLMTCNCRFFLKNGKGYPWKATGEFEAGCQTDDTSTDDYNL
jgi:hypothetical protein